jgi:hypothetical protein
MRTLLRLAFLPALLLLQRPAHATDIGGAYRIGLGPPLNVGSAIAAVKTLMPVVLAAVQILVTAAPDTGMSVDNARTYLAKL